MALHRLARCVEDSKCSVHLGRCRICCRFPGILFDTPRLPSWIAHNPVNNFERSRTGLRRVILHSWDWDNFAASSFCPRSHRTVRLIDSIESIGAVRRHKQLTEEIHQARSAWPRAPLARMHDMTKTGRREVDVLFAYQEVDEQKHTHTKWRRSALGLCAGGRRRTGIRTECGVQRPGGRYQ